MEIDLEKIRKFFKADKFAANAGVIIEEVSEDRVKCSLEITPEHFNVGGMVQGGAIFTLADFTFAVHSNLKKICGEDVGLTVAQSCAISFLKSARGKKLESVSTCLSRGRNISVYRIFVSDDLGSPIAEMHGNGFTVAKGQSLSNRSQKSD
ncbi:MAG: PaaI family thioesterase [Clostridiales bacterium]|nr:PaaI family thioesterase [Clostridiales bacterium]